MHTAHSLTVSHSSIYQGACMPHPLLHMPPTMHAPHVMHAPLAHMPPTTLAPHGQTHGSKNINLRKLRLRVVASTLCFSQSDITYDIVAFTPILDLDDIWVDVQRNLKMTWYDFVIFCCRHVWTVTLVTMQPISHFIKSFLSLS